MSNVVRFGVSLEPDVLKSLDEFKERKRFPNRSQAIRFIIEESLVKESWQKNQDVCGVLVIIYDHHRRDFMNKFISIQHDYQDVILASQHVHIDHHNCMETINLKGGASILHELSDRLLALKGVKHGKLVTTGL